MITAPTITIEDITNNNEAANEVGEIGERITDIEFAIADNDLEEASQILDEILPALSAVNAYCKAHLGEVEAEAE